MLMNKFEFYELISVEATDAACGSSEHCTQSGSALFKELERMSHDRHC
jgi:hypothetical protein